MLLGNGYYGNLIVKDNGQNVLFNNNFPSSKPTISFTHTVLTNGLLMEFDRFLDIEEIEVFGGMYEQYIITLCTTFSYKIKNTVTYTQHTQNETLIQLMLDYFFHI